MPSLAFLRRVYKGEVYSYQRDHVITSKIVNPRTDHILSLLKDSNELGMIKQNYVRNANDWLCFITVSCIF